MGRKKLFARTTSSCYSYLHSWWVRVPDKAEHVWKGNEITYNVSHEWVIKVRFWHEQLNRSQHSWDVEGWSPGTLHIDREADAITLIRMDTRISVSLMKAACCNYSLTHHSLLVATWEHLDKSFQQNQCLDDRLESEIGSEVVQMDTFGSTEQHRNFIIYA